MSDPSDLSNIHEEDSGVANVSTLPGPSGAPLISPHSSTQRRRRGSSVSRVDIGHFDPSGVRELRRNLSRISGNPEPDDANLEKGTSKDKSVNFYAAFTPGDGPFDFEKTLRMMVKK